MIAQVYYVYKQVSYQSSSLLSMEKLKINLEIYKLLRKFGFDEKFCAILIQ